jgi:hypothetical protein
VNGGVTALAALFAAATISIHPAQAVPDLLVELQAKGAAKLSEIEANTKKTDFNERYAKFQDDTKKAVETTSKISEQLKSGEIQEQLNAKTLAPLADTAKGVRSSAADGSLKGMLKGESGVTKAALDSTATTAASIKEEAAKRIAQNIATVKANTAESSAPLAEKLQDTSSRLAKASGEAGASIGGALKEVQTNKIDLKEVTKSAATTVAKAAVDGTVYTAVKTGESITAGVSSTASTVIEKGGVAAERIKPVIDLAASSASGVVEDTAEVGAKLQTNVAPAIDTLSKSLAKE